MSSIRYANDLLLTELVRQATAEWKSFNHHLTDGYLNAAFLRASTLQKQLEDIQHRLNKIRWPDET
jgi:hypothetical protein